MALSGPRLAVTMHCRVSVALSGQILASVFDKRLGFKALEVAAAMAEVVNYVYRRTPRNPQGDVQVC